MSIYDEIGQAIEIASDLKSEMKRRKELWFDEEELKFIKKISSKAIQSVNNTILEVDSERLKKLKQANVKL